MHKLLPFCLLLAGCASVPGPIAGMLGLPGNVAAGSTGTEADFRGADLLAGNQGATRLPLAVPPNMNGYAVALSPSETQLAYATPDGLFVSDLGGTARKVAEPHGSLRLGGLMWSPDGQSVLECENEIEQTCTTDSHGGKECASSSADDFGRLERVAIADGTRTMLAQHVYGLNPPILLPDHQTALIIGAPNDNSSPVNQHLYRLDLGSGKLTPLVTDRNVRGVQVAPDGKHTAFVDDGGLEIVSVADGTLAGPAKLDDPAGATPLWSADSQTVHVVWADRLNTLPLLDFSLDAKSGASRNIAVPQGEGVFGEGMFNEFPDGSRVLSAGATGMQQPARLDLLDLDQGAVQALLPQGNFLHFTGKGNDFVCTVGKTYYQHYYLVKPTTRAEGSGR